jgi:hypothetical protein
MEVEQRRAFAELEARRQRANERVGRFRHDMEAAAVDLKRWAAGMAKANEREWHGYPSATQLIEAEIGREALTVARGRLRAGASLDQALFHAKQMVEEQLPEIVDRLGLQTDAWGWAPGGLSAETVQEANRRKRILSLRAKAESTEFPEEAAALVAKADELARRYGLDA